jgi:hypothetical protein
MASVSRKCQHCSTWNTGDSSHCINCQQLIDPIAIRQQEDEVRRIQRENTPPGWLDKVINKLKASRNPFVQVLVMMLRAAWFVYWVILSFIIWLVAATPG